MKTTTFRETNTELFGDLENELPPRYKNQGIEPGLAMRKVNTLPHCTTYLASV